MIVSALALFISGAIGLVGGFVEFRDARRDAAKIVDPENAKENLATSFRLLHFIAWCLLVAAAAYVPFLWNRRPSGEDVIIASLVVGFAAERTAFLLRRLGLDKGPTSALAASLLALSGGLIVGSGL